MKEKEKDDFMFGIKSVPFGPKTTVALLSLTGAQPPFP